MLKKHITTHLIYYICPFESMRKDWENNIDVLLSYIKAFNGRKLITIAQGHGISKSQEVIKKFSGHRCEFEIIQNDPIYGEVFPFMTSMYKLETSDLNTYIFYAHAKGVSPKYINPNGTIQTIRIWRNLMYHFNLTNIDAILEKLKNNTAAGCFKEKINYRSQVPWHYSGTFFWFKAANIFKHNDWNRIRVHRLGVERYLPDLIEWDDAYCILDKKKSSPRSLYRYTKELWLEVLKDKDVTFDQIISMGPTTDTFVQLPSLIE